MIQDTSIKDLTEADLQALIDSGETTRESKTIEYKREWPSGKEPDKHEFLADVCSFANTVGGDILYGIEAKDGVPVQLSGLIIKSPDEALLFAEQLIQNGIAPRIQPKVEIQAIRLPSRTEERYAIVARIPRSWATPHMVSLNHSSRFYARHSTGKYQLDVGEIRSAFLRSEALAERVRNFRLDRLAKITAGETPVLLPDGPKIVLHLLPFSAFDLAARSVMEVLEDQQIWQLNPIYRLRSSHRYNFDGVVTFGDPSRGALDYVQLFRHGALEAVDLTCMQHITGEHTIASTLFEKGFIEALPKYLVFLKQLQIELPFVLFLSLLGVSGYRMAVRSNLFQSDSQPIDRDSLLVPDLLIDAIEIDAATLLRPAFDAVWNAAGWSRSMNYNAEGQWMRS